MAGRLATGWPQLADSGWLADPCGPALARSFLRDMRGETGTRLGPVRRVRGRLTRPATSRPASAADASPRLDQAAGDSPEPSRTT